MATNLNSPVLCSADKQWSAYLSLLLAQRNGRSYVQRRQHHGPLLIQRPFYPEKGLCHIYLLHPPAGVVGGDQLKLDIDVQSDAQALVTTPSANKFYSSSHNFAHVEQQFKVDNGASLEWLPQETILYENALASLDTRIELAADARYMGWDIVCLGRPAAGKRFVGGHWTQRLEVRIDQRPLLVERLVLDPDDPLLEAEWGLGGNIVSGTLVFVAPGRDLAKGLETLHKNKLEKPETGFGRVTRADGLLIARYLGSQGNFARRWFESLWATLRPEVLGIEACSPRIWLT